MYSSFILVRAKLQKQMLAILAVLFHSITQILRANAVVLQIKQWPLISMSLSLRYSLSTVGFHTSCPADSMIR